MKLAMLTLFMFIASTNIYSEEVINSISEYSPNNASRVYGAFIPKSMKKQKYYIDNSFLNLKRLLINDQFRYKPIINWHSNKIVEISNESLGPSKYSIFYDLQKDLLSKEVWFVIAYDEITNLALLGEDRLILVNVFTGEEKYEIFINDIKLTAINYLIVKNAVIKKEHIRFEYLSKDGQTKIFKSTFSKLKKLY